LAQTALGELAVLHQTSYVDFRGPTSKRRAEEEGERKGKGKRWEERGEEVKGRQY